MLGFKAVDLPELFRFFSGSVRSRAAPETSLFSDRRTPRRIGWRDHWIICRQFPPDKVFDDAEAVDGQQMSAERLRAIPALEANHVILLDRSPDRHGRPKRLLRRWRPSETSKSAMHLDDQSYELVGPDLVMPHVAARDARDLIEIAP